VGRSAGTVGSRQRGDGTQRSTGQSRQRASETNHGAGAVCRGDTGGAWSISRRSAGMRPRNAGCAPTQGSEAHRRDDGWWRVGLAVAGLAWRWIGSDDGGAIPPPTYSPSWVRPPLSQVARRCRCEAELPGFLLHALARTGFLGMRVGGPRAGADARSKLRYSGLPAVQTHLAPGGPETSCLRLLAVTSTRLGGSGAGSVAMVRSA
jgi:hypothetical protein